MQNKIMKLGKSISFYSISFFAILGVVNLAYTQEIKIKSLEVQEVAEQSVPPVFSEADKINRYLESKGSPMAGVGQACVDIASKYQVPCDWLIAIAGYESSFGKKGYAVGTNNAWGYGIHLGYRYGSWAEGMEALAKGLRTGYLDRGATDLWSIGNIYCPPNTDGNGGYGSWANGVESMRMELEQFK